MKLPSLMKQPAALLWPGLIAACSLMACAVREVPYVPPPPLIVQTALCPAPAVPPLPQIEAAQPLDAPLNIAQILRRDDVLRRYLQGLQSTIRCYEAQTGENHE